MRSWTSVTLLFTPFLCPSVALGVGYWGVIVRIADLRIARARRHGVVVGLSSETVQRIAVADFLAAASEWRDLAFLFDELGRHEGTGWKVPVDRRWSVAFDWIAGIGAVNVS
jgi:hypothetical protein